MKKIKDHIPNLFTMTSLFLGFSAILACLQAVKGEGPGDQRHAPAQLRNDRLYKRTEAVIENTRCVY